MDQNLLNDLKKRHKAHLIELRAEMFKQREMLQRPTCKLEDDGHDVKQNEIERLTRQMAGLSVLIEDYEKEGL